MEEGDMNEREINRYWKEIINTMNDGLVLIGPDGTIMMVNRALERLTGYDRQEILGRPCTAFNCDACEIARNRGKSKWCLLFEEGVLSTKQCMIMRKDGSYLPVLKNASLLKDDEGAVLGAVETFTDVTEIYKRDRKIEELSRQLDAGGGRFQGMIGESAAMQRIFGILEKAAQSDAPVIVYGESGTGKELAARAVHDLGRRKDGPYIQVNCAALNESLLESEFFGHVKGAFTGAYRHREGRFEAAHGGDVFLDEIGDVPLSMQVKLLRVLETKQFERVGDHRPVSVDIRLIAATNRDLEKLVRENRFREDFFFRINVIPIHLPPLRQRMEDVPLLVEHFIRQLRSRSGKDITGLSPDAMQLLMSYSWPGNVRELKSVLEYAFVIAEKGPLRPDHLPATFARREGDPCPRPLADAHPREEDDERTALVEALRQAGGNQTRAATILGISRVTVWNRMRKYGIDLKRVITS